MSPHAFGRIGVVGAGRIGVELALLLAARLDVPVVVRDVDLAASLAAVDTIEGEIDMLVERGYYDDDRAARLRTLLLPAARLQDLSGCDVVVECVDEDLDVKRAVLREVEAVTPDGVTLLTNTSSLGIDAIADALVGPQRLAGFHVFNPVAVMRLVEVVRGPRSGQRAVDAALSLARALDKEPVEVSDAPGFVVNRVLKRYTNAGLLAVDDGASPDVVDAVADVLGLPMGPLSLVDLVGVPTALAVSRSMRAALGERFAVPQCLAALGADGAASLRVADGWNRALRPSGPEAGPAAPTAEALAGEVRTAVAQETALLVEQGVAPSAGAVDRCLALGAGWPQGFVEACVLNDITP